MHEASCFITLTYSQEELPDPPSLAKREHQLFMKKLRRRLAPRKISFFLCGEYGDEGGRPHYHAIVFGWWPADCVVWKRGKDGNVLYTSELLAKVWGHGFASVAPVTFGTALYVASYVVKKQTKLDRDHGAYTFLDPESGELVPLEPEYACMSRNPAIGKRWLEKFGKSDAFRHDQLVVSGVPASLPRYYRKMHAEWDEAAEKKAQRNRYLRRQERGRKDETSARRLVREAVERAKINLKKRGVS